MWFLGTNEQPGDYRTSGCGSCHIVYANDRDERHSGQWAKYGRHGQSATVDPTIDQNERGHPIQHAFTRAFLCSMHVRHMHQPNMFLNSYLGYTMWDYESDADKMWPDEQRYPTSAEIRKINERNLRLRRREGYGLILTSWQQSGIGTMRWTTPSSPTITDTAGTSGPSSKRSTR